ncbi:hypothetical protein Nepgr_014550 [Nepenthes gracilis]|uniref:Uncharacterized protein n=1 Tax=Nepenthes gracilis TaxID=150966 RepID=A0AAD3SL02_NEPGR|nr:hypothetical protein Nepgr_014550 [Nepenthes gracilis]
MDISFLVSSLISSINTLQFQFLAFKSNPIFVYRKGNQKFHRSHSGCRSSTPDPVRSLEQGFLGSWNCGTVITYDSGTYRVRYDHLLCDNSSENLTEYVEVSSGVDGRNVGLGSLSNRHGRIRPFPPMMGSGMTLHYGLCVDAYYKDAWWEGVIFDQADGSQDRKIFFPDKGDEMIVRVEDMRITYDWSEVTEEWMPRGKWIFLEILEEYELDHFLPLSAKQIWYELRGKDNFDKVLEWTFSVKSVWKELIAEVLDDKLIKMSKYSDDVMQNSESIRADHTLSPELNQSDSHAVISFQELDCCDDDVMIENGREVKVVAEVVKNETWKKDLLPASLSLVSVIPTNDQGTDAEAQAFPDIPTVNCRRKPSRSKPGRWKLAGPGIVPGAEFHPESIADYAHAQKLEHFLIINLRKHLLYLGWKIEFTNDGGTPRVRYTTPHGKVYYSLRMVCRDMEVTVAADFSPASEQVKESLLVSPDHLNPSLLNEKYATSKVEPEYCPEAVVEYLRSCYNSCRANKKSSEDLREKVRKHLAAMGWSLGIKMKQKTEWRYDSPEKNTYYSLQRACEVFIARGIMTRSLPISSLSQYATCAEDQSAGNPSTVHPEVLGKFALKQSQELANRLPAMPWKRKKSSASCLSKKLGGSRALKKSRNSLNGNHPIRVLRSSKAARRVFPTSSPIHYPRTVLSWLIDNNVVVPREKVYYCSRKGHLPMAEGKITREGIKCTCCQVVFNLSGFEAHAGSTYRRAAANIFVEDGRSLFECQMQKIRDNLKCISREPHDRGRRNRHKSRNDYICSVCHYGGKLILCDQCPSAFHASCLNLQKVTGSVHHVVVEFAVKENLIRTRNNSPIKA